MTSCLVCEGIQGVTPVSLVHADELVWAFMTTHPVNRGHTLVVPKVHVSHIHEIEESVAKHLFSISVRVSRAIRESAVPCSDIALFLADGPAASQKVPHVHLHVIPRVVGDGFQLNPHGGVHHPENLSPREELDATAAQVRQAYGDLWGS